MTVVSNLLEDFSNSTSDGSETGDDTEPMEDVKLAAFEDGYRAGWDDALAAQREAGKLISETTRDILAAATLTREDAVTAIGKGACDLLGAVIDKIFTEHRAKALTAQVIAAVETRLRKAGDAPIVIAAAPELASELSQVVGPLFEAELTFRPDEALPADEVEIKVADAAYLIDHDALHFEISEIIAALNLQLQTESPDG